jgi:hypothetical protein
VKVQEKIEMLAIAALVPYARNSRTHSPEQIAQIAASIREFGFTNPVLVDGQGGIVAGHGRVMAAQSMGVVSVPCLRVDWLTEAQKKAYVIADNQIALNSGWDDDVLAGELSALLSDKYDTGLLGFGMDVEALIAELLEPSKFEKSQPNNFREPEEEGDDSKNLSKYPMTVILDEKEFSEWDVMKQKHGYSDKRLLLELMNGKK